MEESIQSGHYLTCMARLIWGQRWQTDCALFLGKRIDKINRQAALIEQTPWADLSKIRELLQKHQIAIATELDDFDKWKARNIRKATKEMKWL